MNHKTWNSSAEQKKACERAEKIVDHLQEAYRAQVTALKNHTTAYDNVLTQHDNGEATDQDVENARIAVDDAKQCMDMTFSLLENAKKKRDEICACKEENEPEPADDDETEPTEKN